MLPPERQIQLMAEAGIDRTVLFTSMVHPETANTLYEFEAELSKLNDILRGQKNPLEERIGSIMQLAEITKAKPEKYIGFGSIPFGLSYTANLDWVERYIIANGFRGIGELTPGSGQIHQLEALFQASRALGSLPLWVHTFFPLQLPDIKELLELARKYPEVQLIMGHIGGIHWLDTIKAAKELPNVYLDLSASYTTIAPSMAIRELPERSLFSSDAPYTSPLAAKTMVEQLSVDPHILAQVMGGNIAELLEL